MFKLQRTLKPRCYQLKDRRSTWGKSDTCRFIRYQGQPHKIGWHQLDQQPTVYWCVNASMAILQRRLWKNHRQTTTNRLL